MLILTYIRKPLFHQLTDPLPITTPTLTKSIISHEMQKRLTFYPFYIGRNQRCQSQMPMYQAPLTYGPFTLPKNHPLKDALLFTYRAIDANIPSGEYLIYFS